MLDKRTLHKNTIGHITKVMGVFLLFWAYILPLPSNIAYAQTAENALSTDNASGNAAQSNTPRQQKQAGDNPSTEGISASDYQNKTAKYSMLPEDHRSRDHYGIIDAKKYMESVTPRVTGRTFDSVIKFRLGEPDKEGLISLGTRDSFYLLGLKYENGNDNVTPDREQACHWYQRAVQEGHNKAYTKLAECYISGHGQDYNPKRAHTLYELGIRENDNRAFCGLGKLLYYNSNDPVDIQRALELCRSGFTKGDHQAAFDLYEIFRDGLKIERSEYNAKSWLRAAVKKRNKDALVELSHLYQSGYLFKKDLAKAHELIRYLALDGDIQSQFDLANIYYDNMIKTGGVDLELLERAMFWYYTVQSRSQNPLLEQQSKERFEKMARAVSTDFVEVVEARYLNWTYEKTKRIEEETKDDKIAEIDRMIPVFDKVRKAKEEANRSPIEE